MCRVKVGNLAVKQDNTFQDESADDGGSPGRGRGREALVDEGVRLWG